MNTARGIPLHNARSRDFCDSRSTSHIASLMCTLTDALFTSAAAVEATRDARKIGVYTHTHTHTHTQRTPEAYRSRKVPKL
jgi:hypothetical protein